MVRTFAWIAIVATAAAAPPEMRIITARGDKLYDGDSEFRFVGWNIPNLHCVEDAFTFLGDSPWRWPNEFETRDALESVRQMGGTVVRTYTISVRRENTDMGEVFHVRAPGEFNEEAFVVLDKVLAIAHEKGVRVFVPLVNNWHWWGGTRQYEEFRDQPEGAFWTDQQIIADFKRTVRHVVTRVNTVNGVAYRDDPAIFGWQLGNELDSPAAWSSEIAAYIKSLDPKHLVIDGKTLKGVPIESLEDPHIDVVSTHHYPNVGNNNAEAVVDAIRLVGGRKPYFVGEFGFLSVDEAQRVLDAVIEKGVSGALYWSLRPHRREGGFYWHHEPDGADLFKAYHWPGFPEGREYREHLVMPMIRSAAYRIRGLPEPPVPRPEAARLLTPTAPRLLSWQGAAGASSYDVQRSTTADGPWRTIGADVSDAAVQYRPLFADETAPIGTTKFYRVIAKNASGASRPSNVIGPVTNDAGLVVDEFATVDRIARITGGSRLVTNQARAAQEDIHRLELEPGATIVYRLPGRCRRIRVWSLSRAPVDVAIASPEKATPWATQRRRPAAKANDYAYLERLHSTAEAPADGPNEVLIAVPRDAASSVQLSRVEVEWAPADPH